MGAGRLMEEGLMEEGLIGLVRLGAWSVIGGWIDSLGFDFC